ncbi:MAG: helix-turn-helix transcriptional regulator [Clostridia bacterium]|nr:helix-turn-helix transcriptional regulator [Clostridia bacterium]
MFKNKAKDGKNNICGKRIYELRNNFKPKMSQRMLAELLQLNGVDVDKNAIQRMESGQRFITDIEVVALCKIFKISYGDLLG